MVLMLSLYTGSRSLAGTGRRRQAYSRTFSKFKCVTPQFYCIEKHVISWAAYRPPSMRNCFTNLECFVCRGNPPCVVPCNNFFLITLVI